MQLHVGQAALRGDIARYARRFDLLELRSEPGKLPRAKVLREWAKAVPEQFVFSVMLPRIVGTLDVQQAGFAAALEQSLASAESLGARWVVLQTPPTVTPSARSRRRLSELVERLRRERWQIGWEPRGVWQDEETEQIADELGISVVRDLSRQPAPASPVLYSRLLALGDATRVRAGAVEQLVDNLSGAEQAFVVFEGDGAVRAAQLLRESAGELSASFETDDEADDDESSDDEDELEDSETEEDDRT